MRERNQAMDRIAERNYMLTTGGEALAPAEFAPGSAPLRSLFSKRYLFSVRLQNRARKQAVSGNSGSPAQAEARPRSKRGGVESRTL
jgi:hypothetical protein